MQEVTFFIPGIPVAKGSTTAFIVNKGKPEARAVTTQTNKTKQKPWASMISSVAFEHFLCPVDGPVSLSLSFRMPRPKSHYRSNGELKPKAPHWHFLKKDDLDKLERCVLDAMTGIVYVDDGQVCHHGGLEKIYSDGTPGVAITIRLIGGQKLL